MNSSLQAAVYYLFAATFEYIYAKCSPKEFMFHLTYVPFIL